MQEFARRAMTVDHVTHDVYTHGDGPPVILMHELPGLNLHTFAFGRRLAAHGFRVALPHLFGQMEPEATTGHSLANLRSLCVSREFGRLAAGVSAPVVDWLRGLARALSAEQGGGRVGAVGMCLTGAFAIPLILEPSVTAAVVSQPSIPWGLGHRARQLNVADDDVRGAADCLRRARRTLLALRFQQDRICQPEKFDRLRMEFGDQLQAHEFDFSGGWRRFFTRPHSVLTAEYDRAVEAGPNHPTREALRLLVAFLSQHLTAQPTPASRDVPA